MAWVYFDSCRYQQSGRVACLLVEEQMFVFENQNAIKKFLLLVEDPNILVNQETVGSIDGVKITTN